MAGISHRIAPLPENTRLTLSSSQLITSHEDVIEGLVENALDAEARSVSVEVDFAKGYISVRDDGAGIPSTEFTDDGQLARPHCTSKLNPSRPVFGRYGRFLSSLSFLALLSITSRHRSKHHTDRVILHRGNVICRQLNLEDEGTAITEHGTAVVVHNLFGDIPVRSRHIFEHFTSTAESSRGFDRVKKTLVGYLLAHPQGLELRLFLKHGRQRFVHIDSRRQNKNEITIDSTVSILFQARLMARRESRSWRAATVRSDEFSIYGIFSLEPCPSKDVQFISLGQYPVTGSEGANEIFLAVNKAFQRSTFGTDMAAKANRSESGGKGVDRWPMFYIKVALLSDNATSLTNLDDAPAELRPAVERLIKALEFLVSNFLRSHGFERGSRQPNSITTIESENKEAFSPSIRQASHLNSWHRVKSGRHARNPNPPKSAPHEPDQLHAPTDAARLIQLREHDRSDASTALDEAHHTLNPSDCGREQHEKPAVLSWTNPRNGRITHLDPRTGAIVSDTSIRFPTTTSQTERPKLAALGSRSKTTRLPSHLTKYCKTKPFHQTEPAIQSLQTVEHPMMSCGNGKLRGVADGIGQVTKSSLSCATIIRQVDEKFVLAVVPMAGDTSRKELLVLVDQHAADERIKLENLYLQLCERKSCNLENPVDFEVDKMEARLFEEQRDYFKNWCFDYKVKTSDQQMDYTSKRSNHSRISVITLPDLIAARCRAEPKVLIDILRNEVWSKQSQKSHPVGDGFNQESCHHATRWVSDIATCPSGVIDLLKSRACRTAIMFNDRLGFEESCQLVRGLAHCVFPFQCAHGRPTLAVLGSLTGTDADFASIYPVEEAHHHHNEVGFRSQWNTWTDN
ncbi:hypothetical protein ABEF95_007850 [Exophiala dermatitidis]|uniref:DNA mismatch repair protein MLH3 n=1 Tax=Exophiala dermatitidis (strain ATCC 34100 / CBS 525.76 / NIH/UT8656) TaxID=858893 RepID=H6BKY7_EXODN|nr:DNA mismatch repair protein MLH3 [Exophiala dermatitidis NIH/UT8656]EHY51788.1 DNA mismatch repair protein MLH3 [Exophiala dermatitidis NIH/UT8656]